MCSCCCLSFCSMASPSRAASRPWPISARSPLRSRSRCRDPYMPPKARYGCSGCGAAAWDLMKTIVHISADFPDPLQRAKTRAVEILLAATPGFRHVVYSLNRVSWRSDLAALRFDEDRVAIAYGAPPYGIGLSRYLAPVADLILRDLERRGVQPDLV